MYDNNTFTFEVSSCGWRGHCCSRAGTQGWNDKTGALSILKRKGKVTALSVTIQETSTVASEEGTEDGTASCRVCTAEEEEDSPRWKTVYIVLRKTKIRQGEVSVQPSFQSGSSLANHRRTNDKYLAALSLMVTRYRVKRLRRTLIASVDHARMRSVAFQGQLPTSCLLLIS